MIEINLLPEHLRRKKKPQFLKTDMLNLSKETIIGLFGGLIVLLIFLHLILFIVTAAKYIQYRSLKKQWAKILPAKEEVDGVLNELRSLQNKLTSIEKVTTGKRISWSSKLNDISDSIPRGLWLTKISLGAKIFLMEGSAISGKLGNDMASIGVFTTNLKTRKNFMNSLKNLEVGSIQRRQIKSTEVADFLITIKAQ